MTLDNDTETVNIKIRRIFLWLSNRHLELDLDNDLQGPLRVGFYFYIGHHIIYHVHETSGTFYVQIMSLIN